MIHGLMVFLATSRIDLAVLEVVTHIIIDYTKGKNLINPHIDQIAHIIMKFIYAGMIL